MPEDHEKYEAPHYLDDLHKALKMGDWAEAASRIPTPDKHEDLPVADVIEMAQWVDMVNRSYGGSE